MEQKRESNRQQRTYKMIGLDKDLVRFVDELIAEIRYSGGKKLSRTQVMNALFSLMKDLDIDVDGVKTEEELVERIQKVMGKNSTELGENSTK